MIPNSEFRTPHLPDFLVLHPRLFHPNGIADDFDCPHCQTLLQFNFGLLDPLDPIFTDPTYWQTAGEDQRWHWMIQLASLLYKNMPIPDFLLPLLPIVDPTCHIYEAEKNLLDPNKIDHLRN